MTVTTERLSTALADRYRILRPLGAGGMATVYLAEDLKHDRKVAVKVLKPDLAAVLGAERFVVEIKTTAALQHPHILPLFDSGSADGFLFYVMPYIEGETLRDKLNREGQLGVDEAVRITGEIADALDYAHRHGVIHRDIKPENILLHDGRPMVADFGIALAVSAAAGGRMTETGLSLGTPHYMSPEQATAEKELSARSDVYSLASVCYEMLAGQPPHVGGTAQQIIMKIITDEARPVTELRKAVPPHVALALARGLQKLPADRFPSAREFREALLNPASATLAGTAALAGQFAARPSSRLARAGLVVGWLLAVAATGTAAWLWQRTPVTPTVATRHAFLPNEVPAAVGLTQMAFAPDGSRFVYTGLGPDGRGTQLWRKERNAVESTPISGTRDGTTPAVSPDGAWIAYIVGTQLRRIPATGGASTMVTEGMWTGSGGLPVTWVGNDSIVYGDNAASLRLAAASGGASRPLFDPPAGALPLSTLPDRRGVLYLNCSLTCTPTSELWVHSFAADSSWMLLDAITWAAYRDGYLLTVGTDGTLAATPFDLAALAIRGTPTPLLEGIGRNLTAQIALAGDGTLAYVAGSSTSGQSEAVWMRRDGSATPVDSAWRFLVGSNGGVSVSPDGKRIAYAATTDGNTDVWVKELPNGPQSRITRAPGVQSRPRWTPDGRELYSLTYDSSSATRARVSRRSADGTGSETIVVDTATGPQEVALSGDGRWLALRIGTGNGKRDIAVMQLGVDSAPRRVLGAEYDEVSPAISPDGRWLAYSSNETGRAEVFVRPFPDVESGKWQVSTDGGINPTWSRDGRELFFIGAGATMYAVPIESGPGFRRGDAARLFAMSDAVWFNENSRYWDVAPDGRFLMVQRLQLAGQSRGTLTYLSNWWPEALARLQKR